MSDISLQLPDPRQYPESSPSNMLIHYTQSIVNARSEDDRAMWRASLRAALVEMLGRPTAECHALCIPTAQHGHPWCTPGSSSANSSPP
mgnify:CR=1 FL=1